MSVDPKARNKISELIKAINEHTDSLERVEAQMKTLEQRVYVSEMEARGLEQELYKAKQDIRNNHTHSCWGTR